MNEELFKRESSLKAELNEILQREEIHWRQKSRNFGSRMGMEIPISSTDRLLPTETGIKYKRLLGVKWEIPDPGWHKINFDGSFAENPGQSGIGCIIRDFEGICIKEISEDIGMATNNEAEFQATLRGLQLGIELGIKRIHLEGDSLNVINDIHGNQTPSWHLNLWLQPMVDLLETVEEFQISHIYREGNMAVDRLSKMEIVDGGLDLGLTTRA
ncbi:uncharacterized protein LOC131858964 [Cryptomeria japonica]|uniref:uncharacterized protein LOC131858964 n=1 Tax=Cryptomeria japonica TaxID=3369 RepID=UPI0027DA04B5|nr:uncharacterized protein LOC131858964 [Cryptomeria japonica]